MDEIYEPASFAFLAGYSTVADYYVQRQQQQGMSTEAKWEISTILLNAEERLLGSPGPFHVIASVLRAYFIEWGWVSNA